MYKKSLIYKVLLFALTFVACADSNLAQKKIYTDKTTNLIWQNQPIHSNDYEHYGKQTMGIRASDHTNAIKYCNNLSLENHNDWRLPTQDELMTLLKKTTSKNANGSKYYISKELVNALPIVNEKYIHSSFWSSTPYEPSSDYFWSVHFKHGYKVQANKDSVNYIMCVRE